MPRIIVVLFLLASLVLAPTGGLYADERTGDEPDDQIEAADYVADEVIVQLQVASDLNAILAEYALTLIDQFGTRPIYRLRITTGAEPPAQAETLAADPRVVFAEPNVLGATPESDRRQGGWAVGGDDNEYRLQWAPATIRLAEAHTLTHGAGIVVAVLDTGIDRDHPALAGALVPGFDFVDFDADPSEEGTRDNIGHGHGTHVAGLVVLAAPDARIMPVRVLNPEGVGNLWVLAEGLAYAVDPDGDPQTDDGADVINLSLSTSRPTRLLDELLDEVTCEVDDDDDIDDDRDDRDDDDRDDRDDDTGDDRDDDTGDDRDDDTGDDDTGDDRDDDTGDDRATTSAVPQQVDDDDCATEGGIVVVAGAGNSGTETRQYPAAEDADGLLAVGASSHDDTLARFSTRGAWVDLSAPGTGILSTVPDNTYGTWSGTSMAAPLVAGTAALVRAQFPALDAAGVADRIRNNAAPVCAPLNRLDAAAALDNTRVQTTPCRVFLPSINR
jgi:subtilisin family serine protease